MIDRTLLGHVMGTYCIAAGGVVTLIFRFLTIILAEAAIFIIEAEGVPDLVLMGVVRGHGREVEGLKRVGFVHLVKPVRQEHGGKAHGQVISLPQQLFHCFVFTVIMALHP